jgi:hypothetical protein
VTVLSVEELQQIVVDAFPDYDLPIVESLDGDTLVLALSTSTRHTQPAARCRDRP